MPKSGLLSDLVHVRGNRLDKQGGFRVPARVVVRGCRGSGLHEIEELGRFDAFQSIPEPSQTLRKLQGPNAGQL